MKSRNIPKSICKANNYRKVRVSGFDIKYDDLDAIYLDSTERLEKKSSIWAYKTPVPE